MSPKEVVQYEYTRSSSKSRCQLPEDMYRSLSEINPAQNSYSTGVQEQIAMRTVPQSLYNNHIAVPNVLEIVIWRKNQTVS